MFYADFSILPTHGPCSKYNITDTATGNSYDGKIEFEFDGEALTASHCLVFVQEVHQYLHSVDRVLPATWTLPVSNICINPPWK